MIEQAFRKLFPNRAFNYTSRLKYSRAFKGYNANIRKTGRDIEVRMGIAWEDVDEDIRSGLVQVLLLKLFRQNGSTTNTRMYNNFMKEMSKYAVVSDSDPDLKASFDRMNDMYFNGLLDMPNLVWGTASRSRLGSYDFGTNTIRISSILQNREDLLDYVMYHEMLHKKLKFQGRGARSYHHTKEFREREGEFHDKLIEKKLDAFLSEKSKRMFKLW